MNDRRHSRRQDELDERRRAAPPGRQPESLENAAILDLQARAGNRAVAAMLGDQEGAAATSIQRAPADAPGGDRARKDETAAAGRMAIPDLDLELPILSFSQSVGRAGGAGGSGGEAVVAIAIARLDPRLSQATTTGRPLGSITITMGASSTFTLHGVVISSLSIGADTATVSLSFASIELGSGG